MEKIRGVCKLISAAKKKVGLKRGKMRLAAGCWEQGCRELRQGLAQGLAHVGGLRRVRKSGKRKSNNSFEGWPHHSDDEGGGSSRHPNPKVLSQKRTGC